MSASISKEQEDFNRLTLGEKGHVILSASESSDSELTFSSIHALSSCVVSYSAANTDDIVSLNLGEGTVIYGVIKDISVASGQLLAYKR